MNAPLALTLAAATFLVGSVNAQEATSAASNSTSTVVTSLILNGAIFAGMVTGFLILRPRFRKIYQPKSYLGPEEERVETQSSGVFSWVTPWIKLGTDEILRKNGLDSYMYVDYLEMMVVIFGPIFLFGWALLMPLYAVKTTGDANGFNMFTYGKVGTTPQEQKRLAGTLLFQWAATFWILYNVRQRLIKFIKLRQEFLLSQEHASSPQARTLLITGIPNEYLSEKKLTQMYSLLPGGVAKVWLHRNLKDLPDLVDERLQWLNKLEASEAKLVKLAYKKVKKGKVEASDAKPDVESNSSVTDHYIERKERPTHKVGSKVPCMGEKVDTIEWCREEIARLNKLIDSKKEDISRDYKEYPPQNAAFILFNKQVACHMAAKAQAHHEPYKMAERYIEAHPNDVVWTNLNMNPYEKKIRTAIFWAATIALVLFWCVPVGFIGIVSNVQGLADKVPFLRWLNSIPGVVVGIIQSILPTVLLAVLNMLLPIVLRIFARLSGVPSYRGIELSLMDRFFLFVLFNSFLLITLVSGSASGVTGLAQSIANNPSSFPGLLAQSIPKGSVFFLSFIALAGLSGAASGILQIAPLIIYYIKKFILGSTPRKVWHIDHDMPSVAWGTIWPNTSLITVIAIGYMVIAPILSGFTFVTFVLYYGLYRYLFTYVYNQKPETETAGLFFPKAITQLFAGLYLEMVMVAALFFLAQSVDPVTQEKSQSAIPEGAFMVVLIVIVAGFHYFLNDSFGDLYTALPLSSVADHPAALANHGPEATSHSSVGEKNGYLPVAGHEQNGGSSHLNEKSESNGYVVDAQGQVADASQKSETQARSSFGPDHQEGDEDAFNPPAIKSVQRPLWFPNDRFGLGNAAVNGARQAGLEATNSNNTVNDKGTIDTDIRVPPGEILV